MQVNLAVKIGKLKLKNPVMVASGTFGYAEEFSDFIDLKKLGAIVTKTITLKPRQGNAMPRTCETPAGLLNSIGLENPGLEVFIKEKLPSLSKIGVPLIISIAAEDSLNDFAQLAGRLDKIPTVAAIELNISCPNTKNRKLVSQDTQATYTAVKLARKHTRKTLITKLSPNVTDIVEIARAAVAGGSDALSLVNTFYAMAIDVEERAPKIASVVAGLSGPAIRPMAVKLVWEVAQKIKVPLIGMGGIMNAQDALEFILAGATAISVGTANFINPQAAQEIICGIKKYLSEHKIRDVKNLIGNLQYAAR